MARHVALLRCLVALLRSSLQLPRGVAAEPYDCETVVAEGYAAIFTRPADPGGLANYVGHCKAKRPCVHRHCSDAPACGWL